MIIRAVARRRNILSSVSATRRAARCISQASAPSPLQDSFRKSRTPTLSANKQLEEEGIPGLFSKDGFKVAWTEYQGMMNEKVEEMTVGTPLEGMEHQKLAVQIAREPDLASTFNHASMSWNNHFFFKGISLEPNPPPPSPTLAAALAAHFSSLESLRIAFIDSAMAMFGPGFVWLVHVKDTGGQNPFRIVCTYNAGSPLPGAHYRAQSVDMNTQNPDSLKNLPEANRQVQNTAGSFGASSQPGGGPKRKVALGGADLTPLLCVNTWEHAWVPDWGIRGKEAYLNAWWDKINWSVVYEHAQVLGIQTLASARNRFQYGSR